MGAINQDEVAIVDRHPLPGETVVARSVDVFAGGKGANQASAAASSGLPVQVQMLGAVGDDSAGEAQLASLRDAGVDVSLVRRVIGTPTGRAFITVGPDGENSIVVGLGANAFVSVVNIYGAVAPDLIIAQTELGSSSIDSLAEFAVQHGAQFILNNAPVVPLRELTLRISDPLVVNQLEAAAMLAEHSSLEPERCASDLRRRFGCRSVVVTLGAAGCVVADDSGTRAFAAVPVPVVVDTTGAGDCFVGVLASALASGREMDASIQAAASAASVAVSHPGARLIGALPN